MSPDPTSPTPRGTRGSRGGPDRASGRERGTSGTGAAAFAGVGIQLGLTLTLFAFLGRWLDARLGTGPWLLLVCVFVGAAAGFYSIYRRVIGGGAGRPPRRPDERP
jgi:ATP synthase protein I